MTRVLLIGWDGATWAYVDPLLKEGALPHLSELLNRSTRAVLHSTVPPYTNVAWPALVTGRSPAHTGVFDAAKPRPHSYDFVPTNLTGYRGIPIWHWINRFGLRAGVLNVPMTYPAVPLDGYMVTGFDSPQHSPNVAYPVDLLQQWRQFGHPYRILAEEIDLMEHQNPQHHRLALENFLSRWEQLTLEQGELIAWLWHQYPVDLFFAVFSVTDSVNHRTRSWDAIRRAYVAADHALGRILEAADRETIVCLVSDHGSTPADRYIALYRVLADAGWLYFHPEVAPRFWRRVPGQAGKMMEKIWGSLPRVLRRILSWPILRLHGRLTGGFENIDWSRTQVFARTALGPLYLNTRERWPQGIVSEDEVGSLKTKVRERLLMLRDDGKLPLFSRVWDGSELYPEAMPEDYPPDLVVEPARWTDHLITGTADDAIVRPIPLEREYGTHTPEGIFTLMGPGIKEGVSIRETRIIDVVPTLLAAWGIPLPAGMDGRVIEEAFVVPPEVRWEGEKFGKESGEYEGAEEVLRRLRSLGYLE